MQSYNSGVYIPSHRAASNIQRLYWQPLFISASPFAYCSHLIGGMDYNHCVIILLTRILDVPLSESACLTHCSDLVISLCCWVFMYLFLSLCVCISHYLLLSDCLNVSSHSLSVCLYLSASVCFWYVQRPKTSLCSLREMPDALQMRAHWYRHWCWWHDCDRRWLLPNKHWSNLSIIMQQHQNHQECSRRQTGKTI